MNIKDLYKPDRQVVSFEVFPPKKDSDIGIVYAPLQQLAALCPDFISVTYGAGGSGNENRTADVASFIQDSFNIPSLAHLTCIGAQKKHIDRVIDDMYGRGIRNTLILRGDLSENRMNEGGYLYAEELMRDVRGRGDICIGAACYPEGHIDCDDLSLDSAYLLRKQEAGADFLISQLFFDNEFFFRFLDRARGAGVTIPISAGVMPFLSRRQIERMIFMCGASLPSAIIRLLHKYENSPGDLRKAGIEYAAKQLDGLLRQGVDGVHIYTMNKPDIAEFCMKYIGRI